MFFYLYSDIILFMDVNVSKMIIDIGTTSKGINWGSFLPSFVGALVGGSATLLGVFFSHKNNKQIEQNKEDKFEASVVLSIGAELKTLKNLYENEMDEALLSLSDKGYLTTYYTATQDFMAIYHGNTQNLGKIKNDIIRYNIIKTYSNIKKFLENTKIYEKFLKDFNTRQLDFLCKVFPTRYKKEEMSIFNVRKEIQQMKENILQKNWEWFNPQSMTHDEVSYFLTCDDSLIEKLIKDSQDIKKTYLEIKAGINEILLDIESNYKK